MCLLILFYFIPKQNRWINTIGNMVLFILVKYCALIFIRSSKRENWSYKATFREETTSYVYNNKSKQDFCI